jgi:lipopolysaccharide biosynthesis glycosyltransferase
VSKCIYLDVDTVTKKDLSALYRICVDDKYIAGVRALGYLRNEEKAAERSENLGIPDLSEYVNAGVLLMNLANMRRDGMEDKFTQLLDRNFQSQDQDILNSACYGRIRILPFQYNAMTKYPLYSDEAYGNSPHIHKWIDKSDWNRGRKHPVVIHYADKKKPWNNLASLYAQDWWDVVATLPDELSKKIFMMYISDMVSSAYDTEAARKLAVAHKKDALANAKGYKKQLKRTQKKLFQMKKSQKKLLRIKNSKEYKVGKKLLFIPRKFLGFLRKIKGKFKK